MPHVLLTFANCTTTVTPRSRNYFWKSFNSCCRSNSTLAAAITVAGNWTTAAGASISGVFDITFTGSGKSITGATTFPKGIILANGATYTLATAATYTSSALTFTAGPLATTLTHTGAAVMDVSSGTVTMNQPTAAVTNNWLINAGTGKAGTLTFIGGSATASLISQVDLLQPVHSLQLI